MLCIHRLQTLSSEVFVNVNWKATHGDEAPDASCADTVMVTDANRQAQGRLARRARARLLATKEARYKKLWAVRLSQQMAALPPFDDVFRAVRRSLRDAGLVER